MKYNLCASKIECIGDYIYFLSDAESAFGRIEIKSGKTNYFRNVPQGMLGHSADTSLMISVNSNLYIIDSERKNIIEFHTDSLEFEIISCWTECDILGGWAGTITKANKIYGFARNDGTVLIYDIANKKVEITNTGIKEKVMWVCGNEQDAFLLSGECRTIYVWDLEIKTVNEYGISISGLASRKSNSFLSVQCMKYYDNSLYLSDAKNIFRFDINKKMIQLLHENNTDDNGSRLMITEKMIIIPPFYGDLFHLIERESGRLVQTKALPENIEFMGIWKGSKTGIPCETNKHIYIPAMDSNMILCVEKETSEFKWITLCFDERNVKAIISEIINNEVLLKESSMITLERYIDGLVSC